MRSSSYQSLSRRYAAVVAACALPLVLIIGALAYYQFQAQRRDQLEAFASDLVEAKLVVDSVVKEAVDHVGQLKLQAEDILAGRLEAGSAQLSGLLASPPTSPGEIAPDALTLDGIKGTALEARAGNVLAVASRLDRARPHELDMGLALFQPMRLTHEVTPYLQWSYYFSASGAFITMFPFAPQEKLVGGLGHKSVAEMVDAYLAYDVYLDGTPERNKGGVPYWSSIYLDAAGAGWMVSHATPIFAGDSFAGTIGTDLLLGFLDDTLARIPVTAGTLWIVNPKGELVADRAGTPIEGEVTRRLSDIAPPGLEAGDPQFAALLAPGRKHIAGQNMFSAPVAGTPWSLVYVVSDGELNGILASRLLPYGVILLALVLMLVAAHQLLRRQFVWPAMALVDHLAAESAGSGRRIVSLPAMWRPWAELVSRIFDENREAMRRLAASEEQYRNVVEAQIDYIVRFDPHGRINFANDAFCRLVGKTKEQLLDPDWHYFDSFAPDFGASFEDVLGRVSPEKPVSQVEATGMLRDGRVIHILWTDRGIFDASGKMVEIQAVGRDVTGQRRALEALEASEQRYRSVVEAQTEFVMRMTPDGYLTFVNEAYCRYCGMTREHLLSPGWCDLDHLPEDERRRFVDYLNALTPEDPVGTIELRNSLGKDRTTWCAWTDRGIFDADGKLVEVQSVGRDITDRVLAEQAREEAERLRQTVLEAALDGYISVDRDGRVREFNPAAERIFGRRADDVLGRPMVDLIVPEHSRAQHLAGFSRHIETGRTSILGKTIEVTALHADGHEFPIEMVILRSSVGERPIFIAYLRDLTEQKRAEIEIARQRENLHQSEKLSALGSLLAGVAHELNNPLSVVIGYSSMLKEMSADPATAGRADKIHEAAERCSRIVRTFLAMARKKPPSRSVVDVGDTIAASLELTAYGLRTAGIEVSTTIEPGLPPVSGDADQLPQVFTNLLVNAQQALLAVPAARCLNILARRRGEGVEVVVADNGPGMAAEVSNRIFEPFYTTKPVGVGTGVGLSVCQAIVAAHEGTISVDTSPGNGARFTVFLPTGAGSGSAVSARTEGAALPAASNARILVVDDEADIAAMIAEILSTDGHRPEIAGNAEAALAAVRNGGVDLVISDIRMPGLDGPGLYRALAQTSERLAHRLLFITGDTLAPEIDRFITDTGASVIEKPVDPGVLRKAVSEKLAAVGGTGP